ncbi:hypothetical protein TL16_g02033 [Triparma laevis f. inornata]|uniref:VPS9 domain-containing protein n=1 Tax=Triparma laevis f. inornata TaxID=1714386 RepID=A0A9W7DVR6_9STRA|nr:hypothetical protein TL16_g02033 [Triparma laevis f. inornata]
MLAGGELAAKLLRARQRSAEFEGNPGSTLPEANENEARQKPSTPLASSSSFTFNDSDDDEDVDLAALSSPPANPPIAPSPSLPPSSPAAVTIKTLQSENKKLLNLLKEKDSEIRRLKNKLSAALSNNNSSNSPSSRTRTNTTDRYNKVLGDRLSVMGLNADSLTIQDFVDQPDSNSNSSEKVEDDDIFKSPGGLNPKPTTNHTTTGGGLFDDNGDDEDMYSYKSTSNTYISKINSLTGAPPNSDNPDAEVSEESNARSSNLDKYGLNADPTSEPQSDLFSQPARQQQAQKKDLTYKEFLERLMLPDSADLVDFIRRFVGSILGPNGDGTPPPKNAPSVDYEFYGSREIKDRCAGFGYHMECTFETHPAWKEVGEPGLSSARNCLEKYVMTKIADLAFKVVIDDEADKQIQQRCKELSFITPAMLEVKEEICNETVFELAQDELKKINSYRAPGDKIACVTRACSLIFSAFKFGNGSAAGADEFLPVFICVVLGANVPRLISNCEYIEAYTNRNTLMTKSGYCFCNLRSAMEFILTADSSVLSIEKNEFERLIEENKAK